MKSKLPKGLERAEVVSLIKTRAEIGTGTEEDPVRIATQYWDFKGELLFVTDEGVEEK